MTAFERWLVKQRVYCERCDWSKGEHSEATTVIKDEKGRDVVVCDDHAGRYHGTSATKIHTHISTPNYTTSQTEEWDYRPRSKRTCAN